MMNFVFDEDDEEYHIIHPIGEDQNLIVIFQKEELEDAWYWNTAITVYDYAFEINNNFKFTPRTGRHGLLPLVLAKETIIAFEEFLRANFNYVNHIIYAGWADEVRHRVYERGLKSIGYTYQSIPCEDKQPLYLVKKIYCGE